MKTRNLQSRSGGASARGQAGIFLAMSLPVLFGLMGMVVDFGWAYWRKEAAKTAASAAASAVVAAAGATTPTAQASTNCPSTLNTATPWNVGCDFAIHNGFTNGVNHRTVAIQIGSGSTGIPLTGVSPNKYWVSATVTEQIPALFSWVLGKSTLTLTSRSTVGVFAATAGGGCIYTLNTSAIDISMNGVTSLTTGCGIYDNSGSSSAISIVGNNGQITATGTAKVNVVGNVSLHSSSQVSPPPILGVTPASDPFSTLTAPTASACINFTGQAVLSAGTYCNTISINNGSLTFNPGVYILQNGIDIGGNATVTNNTTGGDGSGGVMLYATGGIFNFHGTDVDSLNAPTSGTYQGILMWQDKSNTGSDTLKGGSSLILNGALYFPKAALSYNGGTNTTNTTIVCDTLTLVGNSFINAAAVTSVNGSSTSGTFLVE